MNPNLSQNPTRRASKETKIPTFLFQFWVKADSLPGIFFLKREKLHQEDYNLQGDDCSEKKKKKTFGGTNDAHKLIFALAQERWS